MKFIVATLFGLLLGMTSAKADVITELLRVDLIVLGAEAENETLIDKAAAADKAEVLEMHQEAFGWPVADNRGLPPGTTCPTEYGKIVEIDASSAGLGESDRIIVQAEDGSFYRAIPGLLQTEFPVGLVVTCHEWVDHSAAPYVKPYGTDQ